MATTPEKTNTTMFSEHELNSPRPMPSDKELLAPTPYKFMTIQIGNSYCFVLPYDKGAEVIKNLRDAELAENWESWASSTGKILPMDHKKLVFGILPQEDYLLWKTNALLGGKN